MTLQLIITLLPEIINIIKMLLNLPEGQRFAYLNKIRKFNSDVSAALEKAKSEKDPSALAILLGSLSDGP